MTERAKLSQPLIKGLLVLANYGDVEIAIRDGKLYGKPPESSEITPKDADLLQGFGWVAERDDFSFDVEGRA